MSRLRKASLNKQNRLILMNEYTNTTVLINMFFFMTMELYMAAQTILISKITSYLVLMCSRSLLVSNKRKSDSSIIL